MNNEIANPNVINLYGYTGVGKTYLLEKIRKINPSLIQVITPRFYKEAFSLERVNWSDYNCVAIDEASVWESSSFKLYLPYLVSYAIQYKKKLILVTQAGADHLEQIGIDLCSEVLMLQLIDRQQSVEISDKIIGAIINYDR